MRWRLKHGVALYAFSFHVACGYVGLDSIGGDSLEEESPSSGGAGQVRGDGDGDRGVGAGDSSGGQAFGAGPGSGGFVASGGAASGGQLSTGGEVSSGGMMSGGQLNTGGMIATGGSPSGGMGGLASGGVPAGGAGGLGTGGMGTGGSSPGTCLDDPESCWRRPLCDYRMRLTFDNTEQSRLQSFPVLVRLTTARFSYFLAEANGSDIQFVDEFSNETLAHEIELWNASGTSSLWVSVPQVDAGSASDHVWMYFGCSSDGSVDRRDVWDDVYDGVWHLDPSFEDSTSGGNDASNSGTVAVDGIAGAGREVFGAGERVEVPQSGETQGAASVSVWARLDALTGVSGENVMLACGGPSEDSSDNHQYTLNLESDRKLRSYWEYEGGEDVTSVFSSSPAGLSDDGWHHYAFVRNTDTKSVAFYFDGEPLSNSVSYGINPTGGSDGELWIGAAASDPANWNWDGGLDEVRVTEQLLDADWIRAEYLTGSDQFLTYGPIEAAP